MQTDTEARGLGEAEDGHRSLRPLRAPGCSHTCSIPEAAHPSYCYPLVLKPTLSWGFPEGDEESRLKERHKALLLLLLRQNQKH